jgi:hypothetical protein
VGLGVAKVDQEPIAEVLGDMSVEAADHLGTSLLISPHHLAPFFGVKACGEFGRVHQIAKQYRELAALSFRHPVRHRWCCELRDLIVLGGLLPAGPDGCRGYRRPAEGCATFSTELGPRQILKPASRTAVLERDATLDAELGPFGIIQAAALAAHSPTLPSPSLPLIGRGVEDRCLPKTLIPVCAAMQEYTSKLCVEG